MPDYDEIAKPSTDYTKPCPPSKWQSDYWILREDGGYMLREDGCKFVREEAPNIYGEVDRPTTTYDQVLVPQIQDYMITEDGETILTEDGEPIILEQDAITYTEPTKPTTPYTTINKPD